MANAFATNFPMVTGTTPGVINVIWKLTRTMKAAGWTYKASSNGTTKDTSGIATNDLWGGSATPLTDVYPGFETTNAWWVGSGPVTLKIPITTSPTGTPVRGEKITQAVSAAEGELVGFVFDTASSTGWMVVLPHTGNFDNTHTITGSISGATFTPNGTIITYTREVMFGKVAANAFQGSIYYVCADATNESSNLFSTLAASAGCTTSVWPGGGGTNNGFPPLAICVRGTGGTTATNDNFFEFSTVRFVGTNSQIATVNATPGAGISADGSFYIAIMASLQGNAATNTMGGFMYTRLDDSEPGDVDPYIWVQPNNANSSQWVRTSNIYTLPDPVFWFELYNSSTSFWFSGYQARGVPGRDVASGYVGGVTTSPLGNFWAQISGVGSATGATLRQLNYPTTVLATMTREHLMVTTNGSIAGTFRQFKGRTRWLAAVSNGNALNTLDSKTWLVVASTQFNANNLGLIIGPYDGSTTPCTTPLP